MNNKVRLIEGATDYADDLLCPVCAFNFMHHRKIEVWSRDHEDGPGTITEIQGTELHQRRATNADMPGRRDSIYIHFECENGHKSEMQIQQHKGTTYVSWLESTGG